MSRATDALRHAISSVNDPRTLLAPLTVRTEPGGDDSYRRDNIGIMSACTVEHNHDTADCCVLIELGVVCLNDSRRPATDAANAGALATANALVRAFNFIAQHGLDVLQELEEQ